MDRSNLFGNQGNALANLSYGNAQQLAGNTINRGNAIANMQTQSVNNLLNLGSTALRAYSGMPR